MSFEISWLYEGKVIFSRLYGEITVEELQQLNVRWSEMLDTSNSDVVHSLVNAYGIEKYPLRIVQIYNSQAYLSHPRLGWVIVEYELKNPAVNLLMTVLKQVFNVRVRILESRTEALTYLRKVDNTLLDLSDN